MPHSARANTAELNENRSRTLFNLLLFVDWPDRRYEDEYFRFCTLTTHAATGFKHHAGRSIRQRPLRWQVLNADYDGLSDCHAVYVPVPQPAVMRKLIAAARNHSLLIISEDPQGIKRGAMINLLPQEDTFRIEVNPNSMQQSQLRPHAQLLAIAYRAAPDHAEKH